MTKNSFVEEQTLKVDQAKMQLSNFEKHICFEN